MLKVNNSFTTNEEETIRALAVTLFANFSITDSNPTLEGKSIFMGQYEENYHSWETGMGNQFIVAIQVTGH